MTIVPKLELDGSSVNAIMQNLEFAIRAHVAPGQEQEDKQCKTLRNSMKEYCQSLAQHAFEMGIEYGHRNPPEK